MNCVERLHNLQIISFQDYLDKLVKWSDNRKLYYILGNINAYT